MTQPRTSFPYVETAQVAPGFAPDMGDAPGFDQFLRRRLENDVKFVAAVLNWLLQQPDGRTLVWAVLTSDDDYLRAIVRQEIDATPVKPHSHRARSVAFVGLVKGLSRVGAFIGGFVGLLTGWFLVANYKVTTITFGDHAVGIEYIKVAIVAICVAVLAIFGGILAGRKRQHMYEFDIRMEMDTIPEHADLTK